MPGIHGAFLQLQGSAEWFRPDNPLAQRQLNELDLTRFLPLLSLFICVHIFELRQSRLDN